MSVLSFFFGSGPRILATLGAFVFLLIFVSLFPGVIRFAFCRLLAELLPIVRETLVLMLVVTAFVWMVRSVFRK